MSKSYGGKGSSGSSSSRKVTFFVPGTGIDREVISTDICRYLGNDATARPGEYTDTKTGETTRGFYVTAYRALTTEQLADIKADSKKWLAEKNHQPVVRGQASGDGYRQSATRRQQWNDGPQETYSASREPIRQAPQSMATGRGHGDSPYVQDQGMSGYSAAEPSNGGYRIASFYETAPSGPSAVNQPRSSQAYGPGPATSRAPTGQGQYTYTTTTAPAVSYSAYGNVPALGSSGMAPSGYAQPRENSPRQPQYVGTRDEEMGDYYADDYQEVQPSGYGRPATREPDRRDDRHRESGRRHRH